MELLTSAIGVFAALFSVVNPLGAVPVFLAMTPNETKASRTHIARNTSLYFFVILTAFFLMGTLILQFFGITLDALRIAGGMVILNSGYSLLNGKFAEGRAISPKVREEALTKEDISFTPMAMPLLSGPGSISLLIGYFTEFQTIAARGTVIGVIAFTAIVIFLILRISPQLFKLLGVAGLKSISRIMGFLVMAIGVQYIIMGITQLVQAHL